MNTTELIRKVTMMLLINSNKKISILSIESKLHVYLFSQCKVSLCERNIHDVSSLLANFGENCCSIPAQNLCYDLSTIWKNTDSNLKVHALHYANELLVRVRLAFQKLLQTSQTSRNNKKLSKTGFGHDKALFGKLTN